MSDSSDQETKEERRPERRRGDYSEETVVSNGQGRDPDSSQSEGTSTTTVNEARGRRTVDELENSANSQEHISVLSTDSGTALGVRDTHSGTRRNEDVAPSQSSTQESQVRLVSPDQGIEVPLSPKRLRLKVYAKPDKKKRAMIRARLLVTEPADERVTVYLDSPDLIIGRARDADIVLMDDGASRQHARFERHETGFSIIDLGSGNGTFVNGKRVQFTELYDGDQIAIGRTRLRFESVGWRRPIVERPSIVHTVLTQTFRPATKTSVPYSALAAFGSAMAMVILVSFIRGPGTVDPSEFAQERYRRAQALITASQWKEAQEELELAGLLGLQDPTFQRLQKDVRTRVKDQQIIERMRQSISDGYTIRQLEELGREVSSRSVARAQVNALILRCKKEHSNRWFRHARREYMAGNEQSARRWVSKVLKVRPRHEEATALSRALDGRTRRQK